MLRVPLILTTALVVALLAIGHGVVAHRWVPEVPLAQMATVLETLPTEIGPWKGTDLTADDAVRRAAEASHILHRVYTNQATGQAVAVLLLVGPPGPMSVHMPEYCYAGLGYRQTGEVIRTTLAQVDGKRAEFRKLVMDRQIPTGFVERITVYHSWNDGEGWTAPAAPRLTFAGAPFLYKLYVTTMPAPLKLSQSVPDPCPDFLSEFCPLVHQLIAQAQEGSGK
jgi:hypothetical protein